MNTVEKPELPDVSLEPLTVDGQIIREYKKNDEIREDQKHRLSADNVQKKNNEIWAYQTKHGWVPELRNYQGLDKQRESVARLIEEVLTDENTEGRFLRRGDNEIAFELFGDKLPGNWKKNPSKRAAFPPRWSPGHSVVPMLHEAGHETIGRYPHQSETEGHLRIMAVLKDHNQGRLTEDSNVVIPLAPHSKWNPENINQESMPFTSVPTDVMTVAVPVADKTGEVMWKAQVLPHGKLSMYPWSTDLHYANGFITGMVGYIREDGRIVVLDMEGHLERAADNAEKLGFKGLDKKFFENMLESHLQADRRWIPHQGNRAENRYYIRFVGIPNATGPILSGPEKLLMLLGTPIGPYKAKKEQLLKVGLLGPRPVNEVVATTKNVTNYNGPVSQFTAFMEQTGQNDLHEALFVKLDGTPQEGTSSNVFFLKIDQDADQKKRVSFISPDPVKASVLPGRTVQLTMQIAKHLGWNVTGYEHGKLDMYELIQDAQKGRVQMGMTGTAMGIRQIQKFVMKGQKEPISVNGDGYSPEMKELQDIYEDILTGQHPLAAKYMQSLK